MDRHAVRHVYLHGVGQGNPTPFGRFGGGKFGVGGGNINRIFYFHWL